MGKESKKFFYKVDLRWTGERKGVVSSAGKPAIQVATPPEFKGHPGFWTPEDLYVASVNSCFMSTFLYYADKRKLLFSGFESSAEGILEQVNDDFIISTVNITAKVAVTTDEEVEKANKILQTAKEDCLVSNSIKSKINLTSQIEVKDKG